MLVEFWRVLKPSGNLYLFCGSKLAADTELKKTVFKPLMDYFKSAKDALNISAKEINETTGTQMCSHWFSSSQWKLPTEAQYKQLQTLFASKSSQLSKTHAEITNEYQTLHNEYGNLVKEYDELKAEYESLRRPFQVTDEVPYTDVWTFAPVQYYQGKHPCEKPADLLEHVISSSSRENAMVLDAFMGSGSTGKACLTLNRQFIGIEVEEDTYSTTISSYKEVIGNLSPFIFHNINYLSTDNFPVGT
ncbi:site-specific DNA-methyltransferase [Aliivibrio logei]|uniref:site-specific DNA-methyltransferase n=1 Tax=Aliivibrio logei TaxID=688 RepID=UPI0003A0B323|nr:site-specific DNA-methyltransferase [Aliivibrio logei]